MKNKNFFLIFYLSLFALLLLVYSCTDDPNTPSDTKVRNLDIYAKVKDLATGQCVNPAPNSEVKVYSSEDDKEIGTIKTDAKGFAKFAYAAPAIGMTCYVTGTYNDQFLRSNIFLFCNDTSIVLSCFEPEPPTPVNCSTLPQGSIVSYTFTNENNSEELIQLKPAGVGEYSACLTLFKNDGNQNINVTLPTVAYPFRIKQVMVNGVLTNLNPVTVKPGESITICFAVSTSNLGEFRTSPNLNFVLQCVDGPSGNTGSIVVDLYAKVVESLCECIVQTTIPTFNETISVPVGESQTYQYTIFTNPCDKAPINVKSITQSTPNTGEWTVAPSPFRTYPFSLDAGNNLVVNATFTPKFATTTPATFTIEYTLENGVNCNYNFVVEGKGCLDICPLINDSVFNPNKTINYLIYENYSNPARVKFSYNEFCSYGKVINTADFKIKISDSSCFTPPATINVVIRDTESTKISSKYFTVTPTPTLYVNQGSETSLNVSFTSPTIEDFQQIFAQGLRPATGSIVDSTFTIYIDLYVSGYSNCKQTIKVQAIVTQSPKISPIRNLRAYSQKTDLKPVPEFEVCKVDTTLALIFTSQPGYVFSLRDAKGNGPVPPTMGDFYFEVDNPTVFNPPHEPKFYFTNSSEYSKIKLFARNYIESSFDGIAQIVNDLQSAYEASSGTYFTTGGLSIPVSGLQNGDVYVIYNDSYWGRGVPCLIALVYIREVKNSTENNTNHQAAIEFRLITPVQLNSLP